MLKHVYLIIILIICYLLWEQRPVRYGPGVIADSKPKIEKINFPNVIETEKFIVTPKFKISGTVRVIAKNRYWFEHMSEISPFDLLLSWDRMSNDELLKRMLINIEDRSYEVQMAKPPYQQGNIHQHLMMTHVIPATEQVHDKISSLRRGQLVSLSGYIVDIENRYGNIWISPVRDELPAYRSSHWFWIEKITPEEAETVTQSE